MRVVVAATIDQIYGNKDNLAVLTLNTDKILVAAAFWPMLGLPDIRDHSISNCFWKFPVMTDPYNSLAESAEVPVALRKTAAMMRGFSWANIWAQGILAVLGGLPVVFAIGRNMVSRDAAGVSRAAGLNFGGIILLLSLAVQLFMMLRAFQSLRIGRQLRSSDPERRPSKTNTIRFLWLNILCAMGGLGLGLIGMQVISGILTGRSATTMAPGAIYNPTLGAQMIEPLDMGLVLGNAQILCAHGISLAIGLWLLYRVDR
jgi:Protein of unknown function (DUF3611)